MNDDRVMRRLRAARPVAAERGDHAGLFARIVAEPGDPRLVEGSRERSFRLLGRKTRPWARARPRVLAGSTLGLAGLGAALVLVLSAGGAAAPPAFAITNNSDGSLTVNLDKPGEGLIGVNRKLAAMGTNEHIGFRMAQGPAAASGPVTCVPAPQGASVPGPSVKVTVGPGDANTESIAAGNTGAGTWHVAACSRSTGADATGLRYLG